MGDRTESISKSKSKSGPSGSNSLTATILRDSQEFPSVKIGFCRFVRTPLGKCGFVTPGRNGSCSLFDSAFASDIRPPLPAQTASYSSCWVSCRRLHPPVFAARGNPLVAPPQRCQESCAWCDHRTESLVTNPCISVTIARLADLGRCLILRKECLTSSLQHQGLGFGGYR